jgi:hypothetical protein
MDSLRFVRPGNLLGVGYLILFGGVPQFSIAWNATREPERITHANAIGEGLLINDQPASCYEVLCEENPQGVCMLTLRQLDESPLDVQEQPIDAQEQGSESSPSKKPRVKS